ncbi:MAG: tol-pal system protein YbgF [Deltaproteobacteria bacterium]|nr:MAG: tol-pal system protein YbgF [Deltaproteobacteria bacterium]
MHLTSRIPPVSLSRFTGVCALLVSVALLSACASNRAAAPAAMTEATMAEKVDALEQKVDALYHQVSVIQFMADTHERTIQELERNRQAGSAEAFRQPVLLSEPVTATAQPERPKPPAKPLPLTAEAMYQHARDAYHADNFPEAARRFAEMARRFPAHDLADNALYWQGECLYAQKKFAASVKIFKQVLEKYPNESKMPDAMLKTGFAYLNMGDSASARLFLKRVITEYPFSSAAEKAETRLKLIQ